MTPNGTCLWLVTWVWNGPCWKNNQRKVTVRSQEQNSGGLPVYPAHLQDIVVKDAEVVGILAALVTTITVAGFQLAAPHLDKRYWLRMVYVTCSFLSFVFSLVSLMTASRVLLSINKLNPRNVLSCLESLNTWGAVDAFWWFNRSLQCLLISSVLSIYVLFDSTCFAICCTCALLPLWMMWYLHKAHTGVVWSLLKVQTDSDDSEAWVKEVFWAQWYQTCSNQIREDWPEACKTVSSKSWHVIDCCSQ